MSLSTPAAVTSAPAPGPVITPADLELAPAPARDLSLSTARERVEREVVVEALARHNGNVTQAARAIDVTRPTFHALLTKFGLRSEDYRA